MLSRGILIQFNITDDIDYHPPRWSLKFLFFSAHLYTSSSSPYRTVRTGLRCDRIVDWAMAEFRQRFVWKQVKDTWQPAGPVLSTVEYALDPARNGRVRGRGNKKVTVVTAYWVCKDSTSGQRLPTSNSCDISRHVGGTNFKEQFPDPHRQCILDLQAWLEHITAQGTQIILSIDVNDELPDEPGQFLPLSYSPDVLMCCKQHNGSLAMLATTCGLVDPLGQQHQQRPFPATYSRGQRCLDYILVSSEVLGSAVHSGILAYHSLFISNHRACYLDLNSTELFGEMTASLSSPCHRQLQFHDPRIMEKYSLCINQQLEYHKVAKKVAQLQEIASLGQWLQEDTKQ